ncbi:MAG: exosome non-catalytic core subunit rrp40 [Phylliscum demangeonii]|nr:MAG: exosome non-catalytic core subunit rrp40 [Phylliscum demangeonii]
MFLLPGDQIPPEELPTSANPAAPLKLGPGLRHVPPALITPTIAGELCADRKKKAIWVESNNGGRYIPVTNDIVVATVHHSSMDYYHCAISPHTPLAQLSQLAFENANKKTRPMLGPGALVYARVSMAHKHMDPELECVQASTGRAEGLGVLKGGMVWDVSLAMARRLMMPDPVLQGGVVVLRECAEKMAFEVAVGRNGRLWVDAGEVRKTLAVGRAVVETDQRRLDVEGQKKVVKRIWKELGL